MAAGKAAPARRKGKAAPTSRGSTDKGGQVQSLVRALSILNAVAEADDGVTLTDIAQQVGLPPSTTHRLLTTLQQERYVRFDSDRSLWSVGVQTFVVGNAFVRNRTLVQAARPHMRALMEEAGETVNLAVVDDGQAVFLHQVECRQMMRALTRLGSHVPLHCSGVGKALLMAMTDAEVARILHRRGLPRLTEKTIIRPADLKVDLTRGQTAGYATDDEEHAVGLRCVASPVYDELGEAVGAISISGPAARITDDRIPVLGSLVRRAAEVITRDYGGRHPKTLARVGAGQPVPA